MCAQRTNSRASEQGNSSQKPAKKASSAKPHKSKGKPTLAIIPAEDDTSQLLDTPLAEGKSEKTRWLWDNRLEWGSVAFLQGIKGAGKSTWLRAIAASVTGGPPLPGMGRKKRITGNVLWYAGEEPLWSRVRPGLEAAGADLKRIFASDAMGDESGTLQLPNDSERLIQRITLRRAVLVVIDPIFAFTDGTCDLEGPTVPARRFMREMMRIAMRTGILLALSRNNTKSTSNGALAAGRGSGELGNAARSVINLAAMPDQPDTYALSVPACNNGAPAKTITYRLESKGDASVVRVIGDSLLTADELVSGDDGALDRDLIEIAKALIRSMIPSGRVDSSTVKAKAEAAMIGVRTLQKAARALGVIVRREGSREATVSYWHPPKGGWK